jgi:hypothetical protein
MIAREAPTRMNKTEAAYAALLTMRGTQGEIRAWWFETVTLAIGDDCRYTPDFFVWMADGTCEFHEVKGFWRDDAKVKIKVAAREFPLFTFRSARKEKGQWEIQEIKP